jgi:hypothetical protein
MIAAPFYRIGQDQLEDLGRACRHAASRIGLRLGAPLERAHVSAS